MSLKDLPKSLVDSVSEVITNSVERDALITDRVFKEGLQTFGVEGIHQLSESDQKALFSWAQKEISRIMEAALVAESDCACCDDMAEDDMPGDSVYHKDG